MKYYSLLPVLVSATTTLPLHEACRLCEQEPNHHHLLPTVVVADRALSSPPRPGIETCQDLDLLLDHVDLTEGECKLLQDTTSSFCCVTSSSSSSSTQKVSANQDTRGKGPDLENFQFHKGDEERDLATTTLMTTHRRLLDADACSLCTHGAEMDFPERIVASNLLQAVLPETFLEEHLFNDSTTSNNATSLSCASVQILLVLNQIQAGGDTCTHAEFLLQGVCGCPTRANQPCQLFDNADIDDPDRLVYSFQMFGLPPMKCGDLPFFLHQMEQTNPLCGQVNSLAYLCDKPQSVRSSSSFWTQLSWIARISALLSVLGSTFILCNVARQYYCQGIWTLFDQLIAAISVCNAQMSIAFMFASFFLPAENDFGEPSGYVGANGNEATCTLQGFMMQFGVTGVMYQISLSSYYLMVINFDWQESKLKKYASYFHIPFWIGLALSIAGIPFYENGNMACMIASPPVVDTSIPVFVFVLIPSGVTALTTLVNTTLVYLKVRRDFAVGKRRHLFSSHSFRKQETRSTLPTGAVPASVRTCPTNRILLDKDLFGQCILYLGAFYATWSFMCLAQVEQLAENQTLWKVISAVSPLQGFFNFLVYVRPRITMCYRVWCVRRWDRRYEQGQTFSPASLAQNTLATDASDHVWKEQGCDTQTDSPQTPPSGTSIDGSTESAWNDEFHNDFRSSWDDEDDEYHHALKFPSDDEEMVIEFVSDDESENEVSIGGTKTTVADESE